MFTDENDYPVDACVFWENDICNRGGCDESLFSGSAVPHGKRCTGSSGQDAVAEGRSLCGVRSRQVLADRVDEQDRRIEALVPVRQLQVSVQCDDRNPVS